MEKFGHFGFQRKNGLVASSFEVRKIFHRVLGFKHSRFLVIPQFFPNQKLFFFFFLNFNTTCISISIFSLSYLFYKLTLKFSFLCIFLFIFSHFYFVTSFSRKLNFITTNISIPIPFISIEFPITKIISLHNFFYIFKYHKIQINFKNSKKH